MSADTAGAARMREYVSASPYAALLGLRLAEITPGRAVMTLPFREELVTVGRTVHGGALASLIDTVATAAAWSEVEVADNPRGATVNLNVSYLAGAQGEDLRAEASVLRRGRSLVFLDVSVTTASGTVVAKGVATYKIG